MQVVSYVIVSRGSGQLLWCSVDVCLWRKVSPLYGEYNKNKLNYFLIHDIRPSFRILSLYPRSANIPKTVEWQKRFTAKRCTPKLWRQNLVKLLLVHTFFYFFKRLLHNRMLETGSHPGNVDGNYGNIIFAYAYVTTDSSKQTRI